MKNILELCQEVAKELCLQVPQTLFDGKSGYIQIAKDTLESLLRDGEWPEMVKSGVIEVTPEYICYDISKKIPDFRRICSKTIYIKDMNDKIIAALTPEEREETTIYKALDSYFMWSRNELDFLDRPKFSMKIIFPYMPNSIVYDGKTYKEKSFLSEDTDIPIFSEKIVKLGIIWRIKKHLNKLWEDDYDEYHRQLLSIFQKV